MQWTRFDDKVVFEAKEKVELGTILGFWKYLNGPNLWLQPNEAFPFLQSKRGKIQIVFSPNFFPERRGFVVLQ